MSTTRTGSMRTSGDAGTGLFSARRRADGRAGQDEVDGLLAAESGGDTRQPALFLQRRPDSGRRPARPFRVALDLTIDLVARHLNPLTPRDLLAHERRRDAVARHLALALAERVPVDAGGARIDVLVDQPARGGPR